MSISSHARRGAILLECLVALTLVMLLGLPALALAKASIRALAESAAEERHLQQAERALAKASLLTRQELDLRLGSHRDDRFVINVQRPEHELYRLAVADTAAPQVELLVTVVHRPR